MQQEAHFHTNHEVCSEIKDKINNESKDLEDLLKRVWRFFSEEIESKHFKLYRLCGLFLILLNAAFAKKQPQQ